MAHISLSGHQAELIETAAGFIVRDLNSTNGSKRNDAPIAEASLVAGDRIQFGDVDAQFLS